VQVGDLVRAGDWRGIVLRREYVKAGQYWIIVLWSDGVVDGVAQGDLEVVNESRQSSKA
jgi:hypothetical protein